MADGIWSQTEPSPHFLLPLLRLPRDATVLVGAEEPAPSRLTLGLHDETSKGERCWQTDGTANPLRRAMKRREDSITVTVENKPQFIIAIFFVQRQLLHLKKPTLKVAYNNTSFSIFLD